MNERYESGLESYMAIFGENGKKALDGLSLISPDLAKYMVEFGFGDIYQRSQLDVQRRELVTISALTALGNCQPQLSGHIQGALNIGCKPVEIVEVIMQVALYAGFPAAINAMLTAKDVFIERGILEAE
ncbi:carboxymuconolactone decarboxylase family protein [Photobacterium sp. MCCC 1A19761]